MNAATNFLYRQITHIGRGVTLAQGLKTVSYTHLTLPTKA